MSDDASSSPTPPLQVRTELPADMEVGVHADFANFWHTPNTFVLDFLAVKQPPIPQPDANGEVSSAMLDLKVAARVRIPSEQIFAIIRVLEAQANLWLAETGRAEPPDSWLQPPTPDQ